MKLSFFYIWRVDFLPSDSLWRAALPLDSRKNRGFFRDFGRSKCVDSIADEVRLPEIRPSQGNSVWTLQQSAQYRKACFQVDEKPEVSQFESKNQIIEFRKLSFLYCNHLTQLTKGAFSGMSNEHGVKISFIGTPIQRVHSGAFR